MVEEWIRTQWPMAIAFFEDVAFINGDGVGEPQGFINSPGAVKVNAATARTIVLADVINALRRLCPPSLASDSLVWLCSPEAKSQLLQMALVVSSSAVAPPAWLAGMQAIDAIPSKLFGIPLVVSEKMPTSGTSNTTLAGALSLVDLRYYLLGDRQSVQFASSEEYLFGSDLVAFRMIERCDGRLWNQSPLTPYNGGPTLSPCVLVDTTV